MNLYYYFFSFTYHSFIGSDHYYDYLQEFHDLHASLCVYRTLSNFVFLIFTSSSHLRFVVKSLLATILHLWWHHHKSKRAAGSDVIGSTSTSTSCHQINTLYYWLKIHFIIWTHHEAKFWCNTWETRSSPIWDTTRLNKANLPLGNIHWHLPGRSLCKSNNCLPGGQWPPGRQLFNLQWTPGRQLIELHIYLDSFIVYIYIYSSMKNIHFNRILIKTWNFHSWKHI